MSVSTLRLEVQSKEKATETDGWWQFKSRNFSHVNTSTTALFMLAKVLPSLNHGIHPVLCFS